LLLEIKSIKKLNIKFKKYLSYLILIFIFKINFFYFILKRKKMFNNKLRILNTNISKKRFNLILNKQIKNNIDLTKKLNSNNFLKLQIFNIVDQRFKKASIFDQNNSNPYHLPPIKKRKHNDLVRKIMYDESTTWEHDPKNYPKAVKENGKELIKMIEKEEMVKVKENKLRRDPINLGDKIEIEYYESITSKELLKYKGVVLETKRPNSLTASFKILINLKSTNLILEYPLNSPMLHSVKVLGKSGETKKTKIFNVRDLLKYGNKIERLLKGGKNLSMNKKDLKQIKMMEKKNDSIIIE